MAAIWLPCSASELPHVWQPNVKTEVSANCVTNFTKMMHAWRGWKSSDHELVRRRMQQYRTTKADEDAATTCTRFGGDADGVDATCLDGHTSDMGNIRI